MTLSKSVQSASSSHDVLRDTYPYHESVRQAEKALRLLALVSLGVALHALEQVVVPRGLPVRLGLANAVVVVALYRDGWREAAGVAVLRVVLAAVLWGYLFQIGAALGLSGALAAIVVMGAAHRSGRMLSPVGCAILGAVAHNLAQITVAGAIAGPGLRYLLPPMLGMSLVGGIATGTIALMILGRGEAS